MKKKLRLFTALVLVFSMLLTSSSYSFVFADNNSTEYTDNLRNGIIPLTTKHLDAEKNNGVYIIEKFIVDGKFYKCSHKKENGFDIIEVSGAENFIFKTPIIKNNNSLKDCSYRSSDGEWHEFEETEWNGEIFVIASRIAIATYLAVKIGAGALVKDMLSIAGILIVSYAGQKLQLDCIIGGKWRISGTSLQYKRYTKFYESDGTYIGKATWAGYR